MPFRPGTYAQGSGANLPWLVELTPWKGRPCWATEAEIHPETAAVYGVAHGDRITVESVQASISVRTHLTRGVRQGLVRIAMGAGHTAFGRFAEGWGANVMQLVSTETPDPLGGVSALQGTRVRIRKEAV